MDQKAPVLYQFVKTIYETEHFDDAVVHQAKRVIADCYGVAYSGAKTAAFEKALQSNSQIYGTGSHKIWGTNKTSTLSGAVFYNALAVSSTDFDEGHRKAVGHPASLVVPVAVVLGEHLGKSYQEIINAVIVGYEAGTRFSYARDPKKITTYSSGRWGAIAATATAAHLLKLSIDQWMHALSLATILSPGMLGGSTDVSTGSMAKEGVPWAAQTGLQCALMAQKGFVGPYLIVDEYSNDYEYNKLLDGLGKEWLINSNYFKPYACCRWLHTAIMLVLQLKEKHQLAVSDIAKIEVHIFERAIKLISSKYPKNTVQAQFHLPYTLASALLYNDVTPRRFSELNLVNQDLWRLIDRIELIPDTRFDQQFPDKLPSRVNIQLTDGTHFSAEATEAPWEATRQPGDDELYQKFAKQVGDSTDVLWRSFMEH